MGLLTYVRPHTAHIRAPPHGNVQVSQISQGPCSRVDLMQHRANGRQIAVKRELKTV